MAKKTVASLQKKGSKNFTKVIKMTKSSKSGSYSIKQEIVLKDKVDDFLKKKKPRFKINYEKLLF